MLEKRILSIIGDPHDDGEALNRIADEFRLGRNVDELHSLLNSKDSELISIGAWIIGELPVDLCRSEEMFVRLLELTEHDEPAVRVHSFGALYPLLDFQDAAARRLVIRLCDDPDPNVRRSAKAASSRLPSL